MTPALDKGHGHGNRRKRPRRARKKTSMGVLDSISPVINSHNTGISTVIEQVDIEVDINTSIKSECQEDGILKGALESILRAIESNVPDSKVSIYNEEEKRVIEVKTAIDDIEDYQETKSLIRSTVRVEEPNELTFYTRVSNN